MRSQRDLQITPGYEFLHRRYIKIAGKHDKIMKYCNDYLLGDIILDKNKFLFLSIPHDKGRHVKVDGKETNIEKINIGFVGVFMNKAFHTEELTYTPPFLMAGMAVSLLSLIIFIVMVKVNQGKNNHNLKIRN